VDIISLQNPRVKHIVKLRDDKRQRQRDGLMLVEGRDEIALALASGAQPEAVYLAPELASTPIDGIQAETLTVSRPVFEKMAYRENPDGWLAVFPIPKRGLGDIKLGRPPLVIVAESIEKPGNLGAILRTADAAGVDALLVCDPRTDLYNPNVVRASRGTLFIVPAVQMTNDEALGWLREHRIKILAATPQGRVDYTDTDLHGPVAILVGTEDEGLTQFWLSSADERVRIPMRGRVNSLNVATATALIVYEVVRQRGTQQM
jgi:TrmH family RNA methyltransferase